MKMKNTLKIDLKKPNLRKLEIGTIVISKNGFEFELVYRDPDGKESWKDLATGIVWHDREDRKYTHYEAVEKFGVNLPTIEEFEAAEKHGFREVLPNMKEYSFWSASLNPSSMDYARFFNGYGGYGGYCIRGPHYSVRCVGR